MTPHNNIGFNSKGSEDTATEITKKSPVLITPQSLGPITTEPPRISARTLHRRIVSPWATFFAADNIIIGLSSFKFSWWAPKDASFVQ